MSTNREWVNWAIGRIEAEWQPALQSFPGLSIFADGEFGSDSRESVLVGLRYHFGEESRSLIDRDRKDTTDSRLAGRETLSRLKSSGYLPVG